MPGRLDETRPFLPVNIALLTVSDTRSAADDRSGNTLAELATAAGHRIVARRIVRDELSEIAALLRAWIADAEVDVVIATGGTGGTYLFALPGSPSACRDAWEGILVHQLDNRFRPCNFVELMPRLQEHLKG